MNIASTTAISSNTIQRKRAAELTSGIGALVLGIGLGVVFGERLAGLGLWVLIVGALVHAWGMYDKHREGSLAEMVRLEARKHGVRLVGIPSGVCVSFEHWR